MGLLEALRKLLARYTPEPAAKHKVPPQTPAGKPAPRPPKAQHVPPPAPVPEPVVMYDSISVDQIPATAKAVAGYVGGKWPTFLTLEQRFPHAHRLSIAISSGENAECLDIENGDATPADAPAWVRRQHARGVKRPVLYADLSEMPQVTAALEHDGIQRSQYRLWVAHYTYKPHLVPGYDACQWTDRAQGRNLDESLCTPGFFA